MAEKYYDIEGISGEMSGEKTDSRRRSSSGPSSRKQSYNDYRGDLDEKQSSASARSKNVDSNRSNDLEAEDESNRTSAKGPRRQSSQR